MEGVINLDKPAGITSARAVDRVKRLLPKGTKVGHAGTLDPFATGVLLLLIGRATKSCEQLMGAHKSYEGTIKLGATTATDDLESPEQPYPFLDEHRQVTRVQIEEVLPRFVGSIQQRPPVFSAMKVKGRRAYDLARGGKLVELEPRTVTVYSIDVMSYEWPLLRLCIDCGRGTYIRSIARDLGAALNVGGYLTELRRTRIGPFKIETSVMLETLQKDGPQPHLQPVPVFPAAHDKMMP
jgi:tRNA pseudouridine55 synthase